MNINNRKKVIVYLILLFFLGFLLVQEYIYVHPYNSGYSFLGPRWKYVSTLTFTWWFVLFGSIILTLPLIRKQKIGLLGLFLLIITIVRPQVHNKFPEEQAIDFYKARKKKLIQVIQSYDKRQNKTIKNQIIIGMDFQQLTIFEGTYYFLLYDDEIPTGICYDRDGKLPMKNFGRKLKYTKLDKNWYEFDYTN